MTEKRFTYDSKTVSILKDDEFWLDGNIDTACNHSEICKELNALYDENEQLKQAYTQLEHRHSLLHDECLDAECDRDRYYKDVLSLEKENEQLKARIGYLERKIQRERNSTQKQYEKWEKEAETKIKELSEENEQLKQFKEDVFNKIDMHLRMLPTARDNEFNEDGGDPSLYTGAIYMLETLIKGVRRMTEKRFEVVMNEFDEVEYIMDKVAMEDRDFAEFIDFVEDICNENEQLRKDLKIIVEHRKQETEYTARLEEENEQLKQRNNRQEKQLGRLYRLIEEKDWRALSDILDDFKRCDEQLQKEWGAYGDFE